jgi:hypothetical protein
VVKFAWLILKKNNLKIDRNDIQNTKPIWQPSWIYEAMMDLHKNFVAT